MFVPRGFFLGSFATCSNQRAALCRVPLLKQTKPKKKRYPYSNLSNLEDLVWMWDLTTCLFFNQRALPHTPHHTPHPPTPHPPTPPPPPTPWEPVVFQGAVVRHPVLVSFWAVGLLIASLAGGLPVNTSQEEARRGGREKKDKKRKSRAMCACRFFWGEKSRSLLEFMGVWTVSFQWQTASLDLFVDFSRFSRLDNFLVAN